MTSLLRGNMWSSISIKAKQDFACGVAAKKKAWRLRKGVRITGFEVQKMAYYFAALTFTSLGTGGSALGLQGLYPDPLQQCHGRREWLPPVSSS